MMGLLRWLRSTDETPMCDHHWHEKFEERAGDPTPCGQRVWFYRYVDSCCRCEAKREPKWRFWYDGLEEPPDVKPGRPQMSTRGR